MIITKEYLKNPCKRTIAAAAAAYAYAMKRKIIEYGLSLIGE